MTLMFSHLQGQAHASMVHRVLQVSLEDPEKANQCIFFHYYKAKRRIPLLGLRFKAAAGPHELPRDPRDPCASPEVLAENGSSHEPGNFEIVSSGSKVFSCVSLLCQPHTDFRQPYDPVNAVLDYILDEVRSILLGFFRKSFD